MALVKRTLAQGSIGAGATSVVSVNYDDLTGAAASIEVQAQDKNVRLVVKHLTLPALNTTAAISVSALNVVALPVGYTFTPGAFAIGGIFPGAEYTVFWE